MGQEMELSTNTQTHKYSPNKFFTVAWICNPPTFLPEQTKVTAYVWVSPSALPRLPGRALDIHGQKERQEARSITENCRTDVPTPSSRMDRKNFKPQWWAHHFMCKSPKFRPVCICLKHALNWTAGKEHLKNLWPLIQYTHKRFPNSLSMFWFSCPVWELKNKRNKTRKQTLNTCKGKWKKAGSVTPWSQAHQFLLPWSNRETCQILSFALSPKRKKEHAHHTFTPVY